MMPLPSDIPRPLARTPESYERQIDRQRERADRWRTKFDNLLRVKWMDMHLLDRVHLLLLSGDTPAAIDLLAERHTAREAARERREAFRQARIDRESK